jgi:hypothetical protein
MEISGVTANETRYYGSQRDVGNGEFRRLSAAIHAGTIDHVVILARWNGHASQAELKRICRSNNVTLEIRKRS